MAKIIGKNIIISTFKNRIINGNFNIWQRGTSTTTVGNTYLADRWVHSVSTGGTFSRTGIAPTGSSHAWNFTASASNTFMQLGQQIEYLNCRDLQNKAVTISFWAKANNSNLGSTLLTVRTRTGAAADTSIFFTGTASDSSITLTTTYKKYYVTKTLPANFGALTLEFVLGSHVSGDGFCISQIQLEEGYVASQFETPDSSLELTSCQRYYVSGVVWHEAYATSNTYERHSYPVALPTTMRITPIVTSSVINSFNVRTPISNYSGIAVLNRQYLKTYVESNTSVNVQYNAEISFTADAEFY